VYWTIVRLVHTLTRCGPEAGGISCHGNGMGYSASTSRRETEARTELLPLPIWS